MKKVFYGLGVYAFCVTIHQFLDVVVSKIDEDMKSNRKNTRKVKVSYNNTDDIYSEKEASCPLDRIGF